MDEETETERRRKRRERERETDRQTARAIKMVGALTMNEETNLLIKLARQVRVARTQEKEARVPHTQKKKSEQHSQVFGGTLRSGAQINEEEVARLTDLRVLFVLFHFSLSFYYIFFLAFVRACVRACTK